MPDFFILLSPHLRLRSLVNRASDSGSEGRAFESHRGQKYKKIGHIPNDLSFFTVKAYK